MTQPEPGWYDNPDGRPGSERWWTGSEWADMTRTIRPGDTPASKLPVQPAPVRPPSRQPAQEPIPPLFESADINRRGSSWVPFWIAAAVTIGLTVGCLVALNYHTTVAYDSVGDTARCITPWDRLTGNFPHGPTGFTTYASLYAASAACQHRISGLDAVAILCLIGGIIGLVATIALGVRASRLSGESLG